MRTFSATSKAANAPQIEPAVYDLRLDSIADKLMTTGQYVKDTVNGDPKLEWGFSVLDDDGEEYLDTSSGEALPVELTTLTGVGFNIASKTVPGEIKMLKALMTKGEFQSFENGEPVDEKKLLGRIVQGEVFVKESGWPGVTNIIPARKARVVKAATTQVDED